VLTGIVNAAGSFAVSGNAELTQMYGASFGGFNDVFLGSRGPYAGYFALPGRDFRTGLGSPRTYRGK
jgi:hypothetical protein